MPDEKIFKTVHQYSCPVEPDEMSKLIAIAEDYKTVKNYVYQRFGGIRSIGKLYPGYTVQNEMTASGLREDLGLPSVYFYSAVFDALGDIKAEWTRIHGKILERINENEHFTAHERHYLRFILKMSGYYEAVLNGTCFELPEEFGDVEAPRLNRYLCRQTRKYLKKLKTEKMDRFQVSAKAYRYADGGIYLASKEPRKRIFILLTDKSTFSSQLNVRLLLPENRIMIDAPVEVRKKIHSDYQSEIGLSYGYHIMFTSSSGLCYGEKLGEYEKAEADRVRSYTIQKHAMMNYQKQPAISEITAENIKLNNLGEFKYRKKRQRYLGFIKSYINSEINRLIDEEKPAAVYLPKLPPNISITHKKQLNHSMTLWRRGYIRERLLYKCEMHSILAVEVIGKDISRICCICGERGRDIEQQFICPHCGNSMIKRVNSARNALLRGQNLTGNTLLPGDDISP